MAQNLKADIGSIIIDELKHAQSRSEDVKAEVQVKKFKLSKLVEELRNNQAEYKQMVEDSNRSVKLAEETKGHVVKAEMNVSTQKKCRYIVEKKVAEICDIQIQNETEKIEKCKELDDIFSFRQEQLDDRMNLYRKHTLVPKYEETAKYLEDISQQSTSFKSEIFTLEGEYFKLQCDKGQREKAEREFYPLNNFIVCIVQLNCSTREFYRKIDQLEDDLKRMELAVKLSTAQTLKEVNKVVQEVPECENLRQTREETLEDVASDSNRIPEQASRPVGQGGNSVLQVNATKKNIAMLRAKSTTENFKILKTPSFRKSSMPNFAAVTPFRRPPVPNPKSNAVNQEKCDNTAIPSSKTTSTTTTLSSVSFLRSHAKTYEKEFNNNASTPRLISNIRKTPNLPLPPRKHKGQPTTNSEDIQQTKMKVTTPKFLPTFTRLKLKSSASTYILRTSNIQLPETQKKVNDAQDSTSVSNSSTDKQLNVATVHQEENGPKTGNRKVSLFKTFSGINIGTANAEGDSNVSLKRKTCSLAPLISTNDLQLVCPNSTETPSSVETTSLPQPMPMDQSLLFKSKLYSKPVEFEKPNELNTMSQAKSSSYSPNSITSSYLLRKDQTHSQDSQFSLKTASDCSAPSNQEQSKDNVEGNSEMDCQDTSQSTHLVASQQSCSVKYPNKDQGDNIPPSVDLPEGNTNQQKVAYVNYPLMQEYSSDSPEYDDFLNYDIDDSPPKTSRVEKNLFESAGTAKHKPIFDIFSSSNADKEPETSAFTLNISSKF